MMVSLLVFVADAIREGLRRLTGRRAEAKCVVLCYHSIAARRRVRFARQMDLLVRCARPLGAETRERLSPGGRYAVVTFDDANENIIANALPELSKRDIPATVFVITDKLGRIPDWQNFGTDFTEDERTMTIEQLAKLPSRLVSLGSHTMNHAMLTSLDLSAARREIEESKRKLEAMVNLPVRTFCFPYGAYNEALLGVCRAAGYERVFTTEPVLALRRPDEFVVGRVWVDPTDWELEFRLKLAGGYRWMKTPVRLVQRMRRMFAPTNAR